MYEIQVIVRDKSSASQPFWLTKRSVEFGPLVMIHVWRDFPFRPFRWFHLKTSLGPKFSQRSKDLEYK